METSNLNFLSLSSLTVLRLNLGPNRRTLWEASSNNSEMATEASKALLYCGEHESRCAVCDKLVKVSINGLGERGSDSAQNDPR